MGNLTLGTFPLKEGSVLLIFFIMLASGNCMKLAWMITITLSFFSFLQILSYGYIPSCLDFRTLFLLTFFLLLGWMALHMLNIAHSLQGELFFSFFDKLSGLGILRFLMIFEKQRMIFLFFESHFFQTLIFFMNLRPVLCEWCECVCMGACMSLSVRCGRGERGGETVCACDCCVNGCMRRCVCLKVSSGMDFLYCSYTITKIWFWRRWDCISTHDDDRY